jgi:hypothetical protein
LFACHFFLWFVSCVGSNTYAESVSCTTIYMLLDKESRLPNNLYAELYDATSEGAPRFYSCIQMVLSLRANTCPCIFQIYTVPISCCKFGNRFLACWLNY